MRITLVEEIDKWHDDNWRSSVAEREFLCTVASESWNNRQMNMIQIWKPFFPIKIT